MNPHLQKTCLLGRHDACNVTLPLPFISGKHCRIQLQSRLPSNGKDCLVYTVLVTDTSSNGTFVNDVRLDKNVPQELKTDDVLRLGAATNLLNGGATIPPSYTFQSKLMQLSEVEKQFFMQNSQDNKNSQTRVKSQNGEAKGSKRKRRWLTFVVFEIPSV